MQQAMDQVSARLGLTGTSMLANYLADPNNANYQTMHNAAQNTASLMGSQMPQVFGADGTTVDVNRYRGMVGMIFSDISSIKGPGASSGTQSAMSNLMGSMTAN